MKIVIKRLKYKYIRVYDGILFCLYNIAVKEKGWGG